MSLTTAQRGILKTNILANAASLQAAIDQRNGPVIAEFYNALATPDFPVWRTDVPVVDILDAVDRSKYTPTDAADATTIYTNRCLAAQTKMMSLDGMLVGRATVNAAKPTIRGSLRDAVIQLPTGSGGAMASAGGASGVTVLTVCTRKATLAEKLFTAGSSTTGTVSADIMGFEGALTGQDVLDALDS